MSVANWHEFISGVKRLEKQKQDLLTHTCIPLLPVRLQVLNEPLQERVGRDRLRVSDDGAVSLCV